MTLFESLVVGHMVGDWLLQSEWQAQNKAHSWRAMLAHVAIYHAVLLAILILRFGFDQATVYGVVALLALSHALIDRPATVTGLMRALRITVQRPPGGWLTLAVDQALHLLLLALATLYLSRSLGA